MSMIEKPYNEAAIFYFPLITAGANDFIVTPTPAAGDAKAWTDEQITTNIAVESVAFTSGSEEPVKGDTIRGVTSDATGTFAFAVVTAGTWAGTDAAGTLFLYGVSGAFQSEKRLQSFWWHSKIYGARNLVRRSHK